MTESRNHTQYTHLAPVCYNLPTLCIVANGQPTKLTARFLRDHDTQLSEHCFMHYHPKGFPSSHGLGDASRRLRRATPPLCAFYKDGCVCWERFRSVPLEERPEDGSVKSQLQHGVGGAETTREQEEPGRAVCGEARCTSSFPGCFPLEAYCHCIATGYRTIVQVPFLSCLFQAQNLSDLFAQTVVEQDRPVPPTPTVM